MHRLTISRSKNYKTCKPDPVPLRAAIIYLGRCSRSASSCQPTDSCEPQSNVRLFGISARKVYPYTLLPVYTVVSYTTFSPLPALLRAVIFCGTVCSR
jgi:hypothetical protein